MDCQTLRNVVVHFNAEGLGGLVDRPRPGREPRLSEGEQSALAGLILRGPRPKQSGLSNYLYIMPRTVTNTGGGIRS